MKFHIQKILPFIVVFLLFLFSACDKDKTAPVIVLNDPNPQTVCAGFDYTDPGAQAVDDRDGDISDRIKVTVNVDLSKEGTGNVVYEATDDAGNTATAVRTVNVIICK